MAWTDDYLIKPIEHYIVSFGLVQKMAKDFRILVPHALLPQKGPKEPMKSLPPLTNIADPIGKTCERIFDASLKRNEDLEKKAFSLLSYVTALFAAFVFTQSQLVDYSGTSWFFLPIFTLLLTLIISFRCLRVKTLYTLFVNEIFPFDPPSHTVDLETISRAYMSAAIHNESAADNVADMLKAARMMLALSLVLFLGIGGITLTLSNKIDKPSAVTLQQEQIRSLDRLEEAIRAATLQKYDYSLLAGQYESLQKKTHVISDRLDSLINKSKANSTSNAPNRSTARPGTAKEKMP